MPQDTDGPRRSNRNVKKVQYARLPPKKAYAWKGGPPKHLTQAKSKNEAAVTRQRFPKVLPVTAKIHENLRSAWTVNSKLEMCFKFDYVSPARQFQRGTPYTDDAVFPEPGNTTPDDLTETDNPDCGGWVPYLSRTYTYALNPPLLYIPSHI